MKSLWLIFLVAFVVFMEVVFIGLFTGCKYLDPYIPNIPGAVTNAPACTCDLSAKQAEPTKGEECPMPWGMDVRFLAWSPSRGDWIFIGFDSASATLDGKMLTGNCFTLGNKRYHYKGQKQKSSSAAMITDRTVEVKQCHRVYWDCYKL